MAKCFVGVERGRFKENRCNRHESTISPLSEKYYLFSSSINIYVVYSIQSSLSDDGITVIKARRSVKKEEECLYTETIPRKNEQVLSLDYISQHDLAVSEANIHLLASLAISIYYISVSNIWKK